MTENHNSSTVRTGTRNTSGPGRPADEANDVWSLCVVLYEAVSGRHPFAGGSAEEVAERIRRQRLVQASEPTKGPAAGERGGVRRGTPRGPLERLTSVPDVDLPGFRLHSPRTQSGLTSPEFAAREFRAGLQLTP